MFIMKNYILSGALFGLIYCFIRGYSDVGAYIGALLVGSIAGAFGGWVRLREERRLRDTRPL